MRKLLVLCGAVLCLSLTAAAQDFTAADDASSPASDSAAPASLYPSNREAWQLGAGFQYEQFKDFSQSFHNFGFNSEITRYFNNWIGLEGAAVMGFGHTEVTHSLPISLDAKSLFAGAGPHFVVTNKSRFEPWVHGLVGVQHFRFTQTTNSIGLGSNSALGFEVGGGVDIKIAGRVNWRVQADYLGSHFNSAIQDNYTVGSGIIFNF